MFCTKHIVFSHSSLRVYPFQVNDPLIFHCFRISGSLTDDGIRWKLKSKLIVCLFFAEHCRSEHGLYSLHTFGDWNTPASVSVKRCTGRSSVPDQMSECQCLHTRRGVLSLSPLTVCVTSVSLPGTAISNHVSRQLFKHTKCPQLLLIITFGLIWRRFLL